MGKPPGNRGRLFGNRPGNGLFVWCIDDVPPCIGFPTGSTHVTGAEKPRQTGDDIVMLFLVEQDQLFVLDISERRDVKGTVRIDQDDLITDEGRRSTKGRQGFVTARTQGNAGFVVEGPSETSLEWTLPLANGVVFRVLVAQQSSSASKMRMNSDLEVLVNA